MPTQTGLNMDMGIYLKSNLHHGHKIELHDYPMIENKKLKKKFYKFISILIKNSVKKFSKSVDLKIINAFI